MVFMPPQMPKETPGHTKEEGSIGKRLSLAVQLSPVGKVRFNSWFTVKGMHFSCLAKSGKKGRV